MGYFSDEDLLLMAFANYRIKNYEQMLSYAQQVLKKKPGYALALQYKALALLGIGDLKGAENNAREAIGAEKDNFSHYFVLGLVYWRMGENKQAEENFKKAIAYSPNEASYLVEYATFLIHLGRFEEALDAAYKAKSIDESVEKLKEVIKSARHKEVESDIDQMTYNPPMAYNPRTAIPYNKLGDYYLKGSFISNAQQQFARALHFDPINEEAMQGFATATRILEGGFFYFANSFAIFILQWYILACIGAMFLLLGFVAYQEPYFQLPALGLGIGIVVTIIVICYLGLKSKTSADFRAILAEKEVDNIDDLMRKMLQDDTKKSARSLEEEALQNRIAAMGRMSNFFVLMATITLIAQMVMVNINVSPDDIDLMDAMSTVKGIFVLIIIICLSLGIFFRLRSTSLGSQVPTIIQRTGGQKQ
jgi:tetratricopeptide (TPR) repeat protein